MLNDGCLFHVAAPAVVVIRLEGLAICLDPGLLDWFAYVPQYQQTPAANSNKPVAALDLSLVQATSPLQVDGSRRKCFGENLYLVNTDERNIFKRYNAMC